MFDKLEKFIKSQFSASEQEDPRELDRRLMIATTVLFLEMAYADFELTDDEEKRIQNTLEDFFMLSTDNVVELMDLAKESRAEKNDLWTFAGLIKEHFSHSQKNQILEKLWILIYTDGTVDKYEDRLIRKITNLLGMEHGDMIAAKLKAKEILNK
jgi:uncharacterized tellurite resistance protein B-like protein